MTRANGTDTAATKFPKYRMERVDRLTPDPRNPRTHTAESIDELVRQIDATGWTSPILIAGPQCNILAGHRRRLAALERGMDTVPVLDLSHLKPAQRKAYIIWDNKSVLSGGWDRDFLAASLQELRDEEFDLGLTGFDLGEIDALIGDGNFGPGSADDQGRLDETKTATCPSCGHVFAT